MEIKEALSNLRDMKKEDIRRNAIIVVVVAIAIYFGCQYTINFINRDKIFASSQLLRFA